MEISLIYLHPLIMASVNKLSVNSACTEDLIIDFKLK